MVDAYLSTRSLAGELAPSSVKVIRVVLRQWLRMAGDEPSKWTMEAAATWIQAPTLRAATAKSRLTKLRPFCRWLVDEGRLDRDPTARLARIRLPSAYPRDLAHDEVTDLLRVLPDDRAVLIVTLMVQMGLRCGDVARIRVEDIDLRRRALHVRAKGGRGEPTHWEPIPAEAWERIWAWLLVHPHSSGPLIPSYATGGPLSPPWVSKLVAGWMNDAGLKGMPFDGRSAHALRHTCAQHMLDDGADPRAVQYALGHRSMRSTELYLRREPPGLRDAIEGRRYAV